MKQQTKGGALHRLWQALPGVRNAGGYSAVALDGGGVSV